MHLHRTWVLSRRFVRPSWRARPSLLLALGLGWLLVVHAPSPALANDSYIGVITIDGAIDPVRSRYLARGINQATVDGAELVVVELDTPGGLLTSTRDMVKAILGAQVPVAVYVSPPGAQAASAGTFIAAAANFAVMAPGTNIGAASPVAAGGADIPATLAKKINEDTQAFIRSIADKRGRNAEALEETVTKARSYSASEAVERRVVDFIAEDMTHLLAQVDGQTGKTAAGDVVLHTRHGDIREIRRTLVENFLGILAKPDLVFLLLAIGGLGILVEFMTPGFVGPGVVGIVALALAYVGMGDLPVNWAGVGLVLFSMILFYVELLEPGIGIFGIGGLICFVLGALLLFGGFFTPPDTLERSFRVSPWVIGAITTLVAVSLLFVLVAARTSGGSPSAYLSGSQAALVGQRGIAVSNLTPSGKVSVANREWTATAGVDEHIAAGAEVSVVGVYRDVLKVTTCDEEGKTQDID